MAKRGPVIFFVSIFFIISAAYAVSQNQDYPPRLRSGINLYGEGNWREAVIELRRAQAEAPDTNQRAEALYWISLAELAAGEYEAAVRDMDELEALTPPEHKRRREIPYHRGRIFYFLGRYDEAVTLLKAYADGIPEGDGISAGGSENAGRKSAAFYWIGECLYSLGLLDKAGEVFSVIIEQYPQSAKYEAASYRIALINQKKIESELLDLLKWSHEESLKTMEEYQRRERSYDQALVAYQKRIADILKDTRLADLENANALYKKQLSEAETRIAALEENLREANTAMNALREANGAPVVSPPAVTSSEKTIRLLSFKTMALELTNELMRRLNEYENSASRETGR